MPSLAVLVVAVVQLRLGRRRFDQLVIIVGEPRRALVAVDVDLVFEGPDLLVEGLGRSLQLASAHSVCSRSP
jgi:hypothetical protein